MFETWNIDELEMFGPKRATNLLQGGESATYLSTIIYNLIVLDQNVYLLILFENTELLLSNCGWPFLMKLLIVIGLAVISIRKQTHTYYIVLIIIVNTQISRMQVL